MKSKVVFVYLILLVFVYTVRAQNVEYDPLLDPAVEVLGSPLHNSNSESLWYPGQLSAHLQQKRMKESAERCVNVGYPGKFYAPVYKTSFRKTFNLSSETRLEWISTGKTKAFINGQEKEVVSNSLLLPKGRNNILFEVSTEDDLPSIKVTLNGVVSVEEWSASLDGTYWNRAETSNVFGTEGRRPLDDPEVDVVIKPVSIVPVRNSTVEKDKIIIEKNGYVLIDFFHLEMGKVSFTVKGNGRLTAYVGESPEETLNENTKAFEQVAIEPYMLTGNETVITLPEMALRYVKLATDGDCELSDIRFTAKMWPVDFLMTFDCDDERMNNIWKASVATLHTSTHGFYLDGIKRDYLPWSMDAVLSTFGGDYVFGDRQTSLNSLSVALLPYNPTRDDIGIPDYPLHALIGFKQHLMRYGDFNTILAYRDRMEQLLQFYETLQDENGFIGKMGVWGFVPGWATTQGPDNKGTPAYAQMMLYLNYKIGAEFAEKWGDKKMVRYCRKQAETLKASILKHFWNEEKGMFINGYKQNGELDEGISHHAQYWAILSGLFPEERYDHLFETLPDIPDYKSNVSYEKGYEFLAYSKAGKVSQIWDFLFTVFGDWLEQGHTRFPENFSYLKSKDEQLVFYNRPYGLSLCHGANGVPGIVAVLNGIAGFRQSDSQPNHYTIRPDLIHLKWANIEFPVKEGKIRLKLTKEGTNTIEIPAGCQIDFVNKDGKKTTLWKAGVYDL
ncbi:MAG: glycoside hydrolase [Tannerella sp.]|nr:glycoside hydrolase [Tannerella sp.]